jgi:hypothetical protein
MAKRNFKRQLTFESGFQLYAAPLWFNPTSYVKTLLTLLNSSTLECPTCKCLQVILWAPFVYIDFERKKNQ